MEWLNKLLNIKKSDKKRKSNHWDYITKYWESINCQNQMMPCRETTWEENNQYAMADVLSCFKKPRTGDSLSDFHLSQIGVTNWNVFFNELLDDGYIRYTNIKETLSSLTVNDLKIIASDVGVKKTGRKSELVERICGSVNENELINFLDGETLYIISEKGEKYLFCNNDLSLLRQHSQFNISLSEFMDNRFTNGLQRNFYDTMFQCMVKEKVYYQCNYNYNAVMIVCNNIYDIMDEEHKRTDHNVPVDVMLLNYMEYLYLSTCLPYEAKLLSEGITPYANNIDCIHMPRIKNSLSEYSDYKDLINYRVIFENKPPSFLSETEFISFINEYFCSSIFDYSNWDNLLQKRFLDYMDLFI